MKEAMEWIGKPVFAWTAFNGSYIGELENVTDSRPFRAVVKTLAVVEYPVHGIGANGRYIARVPFALFRRHEFGATSIRKYDIEEEGEIPEWRQSAIESLRAKLSIVQASIQDGERLQSKSYMRSAWILKRSVETLSEQLEYLEENTDACFVRDVD